MKPAIDQARTEGTPPAFRALVSALVVVLIAGTVPAAAPGRGGRPVVAAPAVDLIRSDDREIIVRVRFAPPRPLPAAGADAPGLTVAGMATDRIDGEPAWPYQPVLVTLPPDAAFALEVEESGMRRFSTLRPRRFTPPAGGPGLMVPATDLPRDTVMAPVEMDLDGWLRHRRVVRLLFRPLTPDEDGSGSIFRAVLTARLVLTGNEMSTPVFRTEPGGDDALRTSSLTRHTDRTVHPGHGRRGDDTFRAIYAGAILNETDVDGGAYAETASRLVPTGASAVVSLASPPAMLGSGPLPAKIAVADEGLWSVAHADLLSTGIDASGTPSANLSLTAGGSVVPLRVIDGGDGTFDTGDRVEFYGVGVSGDPDTHTNIYRLAFDESAGTAPATRSAVPAGGTTPVSFTHTERFESNEQLWTSIADSDGDHFTWRSIQKAGAPVTSNFSFSLTDPDPAATTLRCRFRLMDQSGPAHTTNLFLNGNDLLDTRSWGGSETTHDVTASTTFLGGGTETLGVELSGSGIHQVLANWLEVAYARLFVAANAELAFSTDLAAPVTYQVSGFNTPDIVAYDVTDPAAPVLLTGGSVSGAAPDFTLTFSDTVGGPRRFIVRAGTALPPDPLAVDHPSSWQDPSNGADLIIVSHPDFLPDLAPLVATRQAQGLRVALVDVDDAYDEFSFGRTTRAGIKGLVAYAYANWQPPAPAFLLLVGNATLDPRRLLTNPASIPLIMPSGTFDAPSLGTASTDNYFVTVAGGDPLPDLHVGRIPAQNPADVAAAVAKTLDYETVALSNLNRKVLLVADNDDIAFETLQEDLVNLHLADTRLPVARAYSRLLGTSATRTKIRNEIDDGALIVNYLGHGNIHNWAGENIFVDTTDIPPLTNADRPFFLTTLNCINGLHAGPRGSNVTSLAEMMVLEPGKGAVASWSPSALGTLTDYALMSNVLFRLLFTDRIQNAGAATTGAKVEAFVNSGISVTGLDEMTLFGDPSLNLRIDGDRDGLPDVAEDGCACGLDARDADTDDDGLLDGSEPTPEADSDSDGLIDGLDADADDDGLPDGLESGVDVADADTDTGAGLFRPDLDPVSTTDPRDADTDGGGAPDGAEDRDANGLVSGSDTDPNVAGDDAACGPLPLPELTNLRVGSAGSDLTLAWTAVEGLDPCALYRVVQAGLGSTPLGSLPPFTSRALATQADATLPGEALSAPGRMFLVVATRPDAGDGPTGH